MEGGTTQKINLEAGLDISTSDMLVPISQNTFQHNWQKWQGKCLPNSLRFEMNGWAAGWNVYNFDYNDVRTTVDDIVVGKGKMNNNPTYVLSVYENAKDPDAKHVIVYNSEEGIIKGDAAINDSVILGTAFDTSFTISWDESHRTATITSDKDLGLDVIELNDYTTKLKVVDTSTVHNVSTDILLSSPLSGDNIASTKYTGFKDGIYTWGNDYKYNIEDNEFTAMFNDGDVTVEPTVVNNELRFDFTKTVTNEAVTLNLQIEDCYKQFNNCKVEPVLGGDLLIADDASSKLPFNKYLCAITSSTGGDKLNPKDSFNLDLKVPVWLSLKIKTGESGATAKKADNTQTGNVQIKTGRLNTVVKCRNIYTGKETVTSSNDINWADPSEETLKGFFPVNLEYRYNKISINNTIGLPSNWHPYAYKANTADYWCFSTHRFDAFSTNTKRDTLSKLLGDIFTIKTCTFNPDSLFTTNDIWTKPDGTPADFIFSEKNISTYRSIRLKSEPDIKDTTDNFVYVDSVLLKDKVKLLSDYVCVRTVDSPTMYSIGQPRATLSQLYSDSKYVGGTFVKADTALTDDAKFWPFDYVPKFNYLDADGEEHKGCYYADADKYIDNIEEFKAFVLGVYSAEASLMHDVIVEDSDFNRTRDVTVFDPLFDFDYITDAAEKSKWNAAWDAWYPGVASPQTFTNVNDDDTYLNYKYINKITATASIFYTSPGINIGNMLGNTNAFVSCLNSRGVIIYDGSTGGITGDIFEHCNNKNDKYIFSNDTTPGLLTTSLTGTITLPYYFEKSTAEDKPAEDLVFKYASNYAGHSIINLPTKEDPVPCSLTSGKVSFSYIKTDASCWLDNFNVEYTNGAATHSLVLGSNVEEVTLTDDIRSKLSLHGTITEGLKLSVPLYGHVGIKLTYKDIVSVTNAVTSSDNYFSVLTLENKEIANKKVIYLDRDSLEKGQYIFTPKLKGITVNKLSSSDTYVYITLDLSSADGSSLYYAPAVYKLSEDGTGSEEYLQEHYVTPVIDSNGNMSVQSDTLCSTPVKGTAVIGSLPSSVYAAFDKNDDKVHSFYNTFDIIVKQNNIKLDYADVDTGIVKIIWTVNNEELVFNYNITTKQYYSPKYALNISGTDLNVLPVETTEGGAKLPLKIDLVYSNNAAKVTKATDGWVVSNVEEGIVDVHNTDNTFSFKYDTISQTLVDMLSTVINVVATDTKQSLAFTYEEYVEIVALLKGAFGAVKNGNSISFEYLGKSYVVDLSVFEGKSSYLNVVSTDVRSANNHNSIGRVSSEQEYQFLKQQWNSTVEVENYWWIDSKHILELNKTAFVLKKNTNELDDWNGNRWVKIWDIDRSDVIKTNNIRYTCANVYNTDASSLFLTFDVLNDSTVTCTAYNTRQHLNKSFEFNMELIKRNIGEKLNNRAVANSTAYLCTYNTFTAAQLLSQAVFSTTITDDRLIVGVHLSNNFNQWTIVYNLLENKVEKCIQGYGFVSIKGDITGGQIPVDYFDADKGFNDTVLPISTLSKITNSSDVDTAYIVHDINLLNNIEARVVGTAGQQWYIKGNLHGVVSHLTYDGNGRFTVQTLPITNNFAASYKSPSFASSLFGDVFVQAKAVADLFNFDGAVNAAWRALMGIALWPSVFSYQPRFSSFAYLQQTLGQYAYVHHNASRNTIEKVSKSTADKNDLQNEESAALAPILSDDFTFDKQILQQSTKLSADSTKTFQMLFWAFASALTVFDKKQSVNELQNQTATSDLGKKYCQVALENIEGMLASSIMTQSSDCGLSSKVVGVKSLDMFYSTSDNQHVYAGPGFVEHQFVANCVAQSATDVQAEGRVQHICYWIKALTVYQHKLTATILHCVAKWVDSIANSTGGQQVCGNNASLVGAGMKLAGQIAELAGLAIEAIYIEIDEMLNAFAAKGVTSETVGYVSKHALNMEGTHKYGEKNEEFMWPCWGVPSEGLDYTDEKVVAGIKRSTWPLTLSARKADFGSSFLFVASQSTPENSSNTWPATKAAGSAQYDHNGNVDFYTATCYGESAVRKLPVDMAKVEGVSAFLPTQPFKNENIGVSDPAFAPSLSQDYIIDKDWQLSQYCTYGMTQWVTCKDTKVIDCAPSNIIVTKNFCGIAAPYTAVEVKRGIQKAYMRPYAITPNTLALNNTGYNAIFEDKLYHAFDGVSYRIVDFVGSPGLNKNKQTFLYSFQLNDRFKRSNKLPANELQGNFEARPVQYVDSIDKFWTLTTVAAEGKGLEAGTIGEDKDLIRWAVPVFTEPVNTLPASVKTLTAMPLGVVEGVTSLCTDLANNQSAYKAPVSIDFAIGKNMYRVTPEYICSVQTQNGVDVVTDIVPSLGLMFIGATPIEAFFYSKTTRCYYSFSGSSLSKLNMMERFRDVQRGYWDFINQEVVMPCLMTFKRLNSEVEDKDTETDNIIVPVLSNGMVSGELPPPATTIFNDRSWYTCVSLPAGFAYQGPNRVIINRNVFVEYMLDSMKANIGKWKKMSREKYNTKREYPEQYTAVDKEVTGVSGWTYNPFLLVTSALGMSENADCLYEWTITFCWPIEMDLLYAEDNFAVVNITAETMTPGGKVKSRPTHVFLTKELFTRNGNYGYYSFKYQSKNGAGNRERLHIWSDQYVAVSSVDCEAKVVTNRRTEQLTQQVDVQKLKEL